MANIMDPIDDPSYNVEATERPFGTSASDSRRNIGTYNATNDTGSGLYGYPEYGHSSGITNSATRGNAGGQYGHASGISPSTSPVAQGAVNPTQEQYPHDTREQPTQHVSPLHQSQYSTPGSTDLSHGTNVPTSTVAGYGSSNVKHTGPHMNNSYHDINSYNTRGHHGQSSRNASPFHQSQQTMPDTTELSHGSRVPSSTAPEFEPRIVKDHNEPRIDGNYDGSNVHGKGDLYHRHDSSLQQSQTSMPGAAESTHDTEVPASTATVSQTSNPGNESGPRLDSAREANADASDTSDTNRKKGERFEGNQDDDITGEKVNGIAGVIPISGSAGPTTTKTFDPHAELGNASNNVSATAPINNDGKDQKAPARQHDAASSSYNTLRSDAEQTTANSEGRSGLGKNSRSGTGLGEVQSVESRSAV
ncbi:hypothetical protein ASPBRDRAFT_48057 [Aspergillus brasiliensis CBS 101740]|uniref:Uncharacterized protein n=1 Tax=Aspergillus brasiliensis (strain CBS 101740 / IMI 381727 / IBT 21946) TaxID=767769 RepID=A0A1L9U758_ASPBC|nr:hypothetical protein ASPBRDRAFT_48057 [Aspergillus brasiliensis CBS 101740]